MEVQSRWYAGFFILAAVFLAAGLYLRHQETSGPYRRICEFVSERIYLSEKEIAEWRARCLERARLVDPYRPAPEEIVADVRLLFGELGVSHLDLYDADQSRQIWQSEDRETGIDSEFVDGALVIFEVQPSSPAEERGLRRGDVLLSIQGNHPAPEIARRFGGNYRVDRAGRVFDVSLEPRELRRDDGLKILRKDRYTVLKVPSFRADFFEKVAWRKIVEDLKGTRTLIVDLRGNGGGNFVAGLRFLSPFMCATQEVGYLMRPSSRLEAQADLVDDLDDGAQIHTIVNNDLVHLKTYDDDYGCLTSSVRVLTDARTSSTAEMVAQALRDYLGAPIFGTATSGQLLVGVWHPFPELGPGWRISIPEAVYQSRRGARIEGRGVRPDHEVYYDLALLRRGRDSWIEAAAKHVSK